MYNDTKEEVVAEIAATDIWASCATRGYITITAHFINKNWKVRNLILATRAIDDKRSGLHIAHEMKAIRKNLISDLLVLLLTMPLRQGNTNARCFIYSAFHMVLNWQ